MFLEERYEKIIECVELSGRATVKELAKKFEVTEDCIRKDLRMLENRGSIKRVHGGAIYQREHNKVKKVNERIEINSEQKKKIAIKASELIYEDDVIFLDVSTINLEIAKILSNKNMHITIITNMIEIVMKLKNSSNIRIILIGGEFNKKAEATMGTEADRYIKKFTCDKSFIGVCGVNLESGYISSSDLEDGNTKKTIMECSNKIYLVMEEEKFNYDEFYKFANVNEITSIITENHILEGDLL